MRDLAEISYFVDFIGKPQRVIEDVSLLSWAEENGYSPVRAQAEALREGIVPLRYLKNLWALSLAEQGRLCGSTTLICGCGGLGGALVDLLARAGVGRLRLLDGDVFVPSNLNRQWLSDTKQLGRLKAEVAGERVREINPFVQVETLPVVLQEANAEETMRDVDLVLDAFDNLEGRFLLARTARRVGVPFVHAAVAGWWGQISTFLPDSPFDLRSIYGNRTVRDSTEDTIGILGSTAAVIGSLQSMEAIKILAGRDPAYSGQLLYFDGESGRMELIPLSSA